MSIHFGGSFGPVFLPYLRLGSFTIRKQIDVMVFLFKLLDSINIHPMFHVYLLELYHASAILGRGHEPPSPMKIYGEQNMKWKIFLI